MELICSTSFRNDMRIMLAITAMTAGGAERVAATMLNYWAGTSNRVALLTIYSTQNDFYYLDSRVHRIALGQNRATRNWWEFVADNLQRVKQIRAAIRAFRPDVVISFLDITNIRVLLAAVGLDVPIVVEEHIDPRQNSIGRVAGCLRRLLYPRAHRLVVLTPAILGWACGIVERDAVCVIPNPVSEQFCRCGTAEPKDPLTVVAMGRMELQKGFDLLLAAFARCVQKHPTWQLRIFGEGSQRPRLAGLAASLRIADRVRLEDTVREPEKVLRRSSLFVLSSRFEGFPMVLLEAMATGLPVVSFDCPTGPREMIRDGVDGVLVPPGDTEALASVMTRLMGNESERRRLGSRATEVVERFGLARVMAMWDELLEKAVGRVQQSTNQLADLQLQRVHFSQAAACESSRVASKSADPTLGR
jgi:GalNAc-alpha-(1->4)-GalNAc-alpha-(1->3)-diNAcBac-PP-undecaprenol alpha-1,4-N-acetyl-D-galactosaminyltransferase